jgi:DNA processing protein
LDDCIKENINIVLLHDNNYPALLSQIDDAPLVLYYRGKISNMAEDFPIAMVGTRRPSVYGVKMALKFSYELASAGMTIISGMARGIDTICHEGALKAGKPTIAVLGCGVDIVYPPENERIKKIIEESGAVISEYPPGTPPLAGNFPVRNRIVSGLSLGVLIVESGERSGTMITAGAASAYNRSLYTLPTNLDNKHGLGNFQAVRDGAQFILSPGDILADFALSEPVRVQKALEQKEENIKDEDSLRILSVLSSSIPMNISTICDRTGLSPSCVSTKLTILEMENKICCLSGKRFILK